jgi:hypothetical protein
MTVHRGGQALDRVNLYLSRSPSIRSYLANGWESTNLKERTQARRQNLLGLPGRLEVMLRTPRQPA